MKKEGIYFRLACLMKVSGVDKRILYLACSCFILKYYESAYMRKMVLPMLTIPLLSGCGRIQDTVHHVKMANSILYFTPLVFSSVTLVASIILLHRARTKPASIFFIVCLLACVAQWLGLFGNPSIVNPKPIVAALAIQSFGILYYACARNSYWD